MKPNSDNSIEKIKSEHRALAILCVLEREIGHTLNEFVLNEYLNGLALGSTQTAMRTSLQKLADIGLIRIYTVEDTLVAKLTQEGCDTALGKQISEGVLKRPPDCPY